MANDTSTPRGTFTVSLSFRHGWADLSFTEIDSERIRATTMVDAFADLVLAVSRITQGDRSATTLWGGEGRGYFIDMSRDSSDGVGLVIHEMKNSRWLSAADEWLPQRGQAVYMQYVKIIDFVSAFGRSFLLARREFADPSGFIEQWGWNFPVLEFAKFEQSATRYGYKPDRVLLGGA